MTSGRSKRRDFLSLMFISKLISKKLLIKMLLQLGVCFCQLVAVNHFFLRKKLWLFIVVYTKLLYLSSDKVA